VCEPVPAQALEHGAGEWSARRVKASNQLYGHRRQINRLVGREVPLESAEATARALSEPRLNALEGALSVLGSTAHAEGPGRVQHGNGNRVNKLQWQETA
jgi:hypothetical protein